MVIQPYALYNPATHVAVPREPTAGMLQAAQNAWLKDPLRRSSTLYTAMLAAAPPHVVDVMNLRNDIARLIDHTAFRPSSPGYPYQLDDQESALEKADEILNLLEVK